MNNSVKDKILRKSGRIIAAQVETTSISYQQMNFFRLAHATDEDVMPALLKSKSTY